MRLTAAVARRNLLLYFRDRTGVFLSLLSALILFVLYAFFLGNLQLNNITTRYPAVSHSEARLFVTGWVFAGIVSITSLTSGLQALNVFVEDRASGRFKDFLVASVRRRHIVLGYIGATFTIAVSMSIIVLLLGQAYEVAIGGQFVTIGELLQALAYIVVIAACFAALSVFAVTFIHSSGAFSSLGVVVGTMSGFLAGAYIPVGTLPKGVDNVINCLPFSLSAMLLRGPLTSRYVQRLTHGRTGPTRYIDQFYGIHLFVGSSTMTRALALVILAGIFVVFAIAGSARVRARVR